MKTFISLFKNNKGITLIALVIIIIVMLILAGIVITTLAGNNGLLNKLEGGIDQYGKAQALQDVKLVWQDIEMDYTVREKGDVTKTRTDYYTKENVNSKLSGGHISEDEGSFQYNENGVTKIKYITNDNNTYLMNINPKENVWIALSMDGVKDEFVATLNDVILAKTDSFKIQTSKALTWEVEDSSVVELAENENEIIVLGKQVGETTIIGRSSGGTVVQQYKISVSDLVIDTPGDATSQDIMVGKTAVVNDEELTGTFEFNAETSATAEASDIVKGKTAWINGELVTGTYDVVDYTLANATASDIKSGKTAWVNGEQITGTYDAPKGTQVSYNYYTVSASQRSRGATYTINTDFYKILGVGTHYALGSSYGGTAAFWSANGSSASSSVTGKNDSWSTSISVSGSTIRITENNTSTMSDTIYVYVVGTK